MSDSVHEMLSDSEAYLLSLLLDESGVDLAEFCYIDETNKKTGGIFRCWPFQYPWYRDSSKLHIDAAGRSIGKAIDVDEPILTTNGWTIMGDLEVGDFVFSEKGVPVEVLEVFKVLKGRDCYQVIFDDGSKIIVDGEHLWTTFTYDDILQADRYGTNAKPIVSTTVEILASLETFFENDETDEVETYWTHRVPFIDGIQWKETELTSRDLYRCRGRIAGFPARQIVGVLAVDSVDVRCIRVDNPTSLFLVGENLIPTHNSMSIILRGMAFPFVHPGEEMLITAPESVHLQAVTDKLEKAVLSTRLTREFMKGRPTHRPFQISFANNCRIMGRIPQRDGSGVQGMHPLVLEHDEAANYPEPGWIELGETLKDEEGARHRAHGVSFGIGSTFNSLISGEDPNWTVRQLPAMYRPTWTDAVRQERIYRYGGYESNGYIRNIKGKTAALQSLIFVQNRLYECVDDEIYSDYNEKEYYYTKITESMVRSTEESGGSIVDLLDIPVLHKNYQSVWIGADLGWVQSPTSICVFAEVKGEKGGKSVLKLISRILLHEVKPRDQIRVFSYLMELYKPMSLSLDGTGGGFVFWDLFSEYIEDHPSASWMKDRIRSINFSEKVIVGFDEGIEVKPHEGVDAYLKAAIKEPFIIASTDYMRLLVDSKRMRLPYDKDLLGELEMAPSKDSHIPSLDAYGRSGRKKGMHNLDAMRMAVFSHQSRMIDQMLSSKKKAFKPSPILWG